MQTGIDCYRDYISRKPRFSTNIEYKITDINLPYSMMIIKKKTGKIIIKIDLYSIKTRDKLRPSFIISSDDFKNINFFIEQWIILWDNSISI